MSKPVFIPLAAGVQTELAPELVQAGSTLLTENCQQAQTGKSQVRIGSDILSTASQATIPSGGTLPTVWQLATHGGQLVRFNRAPVPIHTWAPSPEAWVRHQDQGGPSTTGGILSFRRGPIKVDTASVFGGAQVDVAVSKPTVAVSANAIIEVYQTASTSTNGIAVVILDRTTRKPIYTRQVGSGAFNPRVVVVGTRAIVAYQGAGPNLTIDAYDLSTYAFAQSATMGAMTAGSAIDLRVGSPVVGASNVAILYLDGGGVLQCATADATNLATNSTFKPRTAAAGDILPNLAFGWLQDIGVSGKFSIMSADSTNGLRGYWNYPAPAAGVSNATATHVLDATATGIPLGGTAGIRNVIGTTITSSATGVYRVLYEVTAPSLTTRAQIKQVVWNGSAAPDVSFYSVGLRSKFWQHSTNFYFLAAFDGEEQRTYFVLATAGDTSAGATSTTYAAPLAVAMPRDAGGLTEMTNAITDVAVAGDGAIHLGVTSETFTESALAAGVATGSTSRLLEIDLIRVRHPVAAETETGRPAEYLKALFVPDGLLAHFDGATYAAACFPYYPPVPTAVTAAGGDLTPSAAYRHKIVYSFIDRLGRKWRSAPSRPILSNTTGTDFKFDLTIEPLRLVDRGLIGFISSGGFEIEVYRTQANSDQGFFQVATFANDPTLTAQTVTITDDVADDDLGEQLYTDGGGVENQLLPPVSSTVEHQGRMVVAESGTGTLWYSTDADFDHGPIFNEALTKDVGDPSDPITGLAVYNDTIFAFKEGKVYVVAGQGANALGQGATYTERLIDSGVGCSNPQSIVVADDGVWFRSSSDRAGIHRTAGGAAEYVGAGVHAYDSSTIVSAVVVKSATEIRFYTLEGTTVAWNWTTKTWGVNTGQATLSATTGYADVAGAVYARTDGYILSEASGGAYTEGGTAYVGRIRSPWYKDKLGGWLRIKRMQGVGTMGAGRQHTTRILLYKDLDDSAPFQTANIAFDGTEKLWQWELRPAQEKYSALMIEVQIQPGALGEHTAGPQIVGVSLLPVAKDGMAKLPASRRAV